MRGGPVSALWSAAELAAALGVPGGWDVSGISIDTRTLQPGDLFVALRGERDGHDFVAAAFAKGAAAALVTRPMQGNTIEVADTLRALERLGVAARARGAARIIAVTGSVGKTTTKEMLRRMLSGFGPVHAAEASFNNHIGVPLTLARMPREAAFGVFEIGMNHPGEIAPLAAMVRPDVAIITCVDRAHLGLMGSEAAIAREKAEISRALVPGGAAVLPRSAEHAATLRAAVPHHARVIEFPGTGAQLLHLDETAESGTVTAVIGGMEVMFTLRIPGRHMAFNALAALAAAEALGLDVVRAAAALDGFVPYAGRGARRRIVLAQGEATLLDESYNASGASMRAALSVLQLQRGRRIAVLGDMLELGEFSAGEHMNLRPWTETAADIVFACGPWSKVLFDSLPPSMQGAHAENAAALAPVVKAALRDGDVVLVKGSYGSRMRDVISALESPA